MNNIAVSVICLTYNHEKYIKKCLDGFIMQKTNFKYEVIVHDDASTDETATIIREYAEKYPDIIKPIFQVENQYSKGVKITNTFIYPKIKGKYIAFCEGDDYWTDDSKLQFQFDIMENYSECSLCVHRVRWIKLPTGETECYTPDEKYDIKDGLLDSKIQAKLMLTDFIFHLNSFFIRRTYYDEYITNPPAFVALMPVGDIAMLSYFSIQGRVYYIEKEMAVYNHGTKGSWNQRILGNNLNHIKYLERMIQAQKVLRDNYIISNELKKNVDESIKGLEFNLYSLTGKYRRLIKKEYRQFFKKETIKTKIIIIIGTFFPRIVQWYLNRKTKYGK